MNMEDKAFLIHEFRTNPGKGFLFHPTYEVLCCEENLEIITLDVKKYQIKNLLFIIDERFGMDNVYKPAIQRSLENHENPQIRKLSTLEFKMIKYVGDTYWINFRPYDLFQTYGSKDLPECPIVKISGKYRLVLSESYFPENPKKKERRK